MANSKAEVTDEQMIWAQWSNYQGNYEARL